jgi:hypothetical protein
MEASANAMLLRGAAIRSSGQRQTDVSIGMVANMRSSADTLIFSFQVDQFSVFLAYVLERVTQDF